MLSPYTCRAMMVEGGLSENMGARKGRSSLAGPNYLISWVNGSEAPEFKPTALIPAKASLAHRITTYVRFIGTIEDDIKNPCKRVTFDCTLPSHPVRMGITPSIHPTRLIFETKKSVMFHLPTLGVSVVYQKGPNGEHLRVMCMHWDQEDQLVAARVTGHTHQTKVRAYDKWNRSKELNNTRLEMVLSGAFGKNR